VRAGLALPKKKIKHKKKHKKTNKLGKMYMRVMTRRERRFANAFVDRRTAAGGGRGGGVLF